MNVRYWLALGGCIAAVACNINDGKKPGRGDGGAAGAEETDSEAGRGGDPTGEGGAAGDAASAAGAGGASESGGAGGAGGAGGEQGDGSQVVEVGPPGSVGNQCTDEGACESDLVCAASLFCQPSESVSPPQIVQAVPLADSAQIPSSSPIVLFADDSYANVSFTVQAYTPSGVEDITSQVSVVTLTSANGKDIYVLAANGGLPLGASIVITLSGDIDGTLVFNVAHASPPFAEGELGFEGAANPEATCTEGPEGSAVASAMPLGWSAFGDVGVIPETGSVVPSEGTQLLAMSTGAVLCGSALGGTSSMAVSGPIRGLGSSPALSIDYNFQSSEFDDFCNSNYDDTLIAVLAGPNGAVASVVNSVNRVCEQNSHVDGTFPGLPDSGDEVYKETSKLAFTLEGDIGSPVVLSFVVTDVGDDAYSSLVGIDNIHAL
ncbi:MAG TPA: hypothetical protein VEX18_12035 [Polyangiaceae bacterium]|nr:hypothetical protein [Polyangiaceae bacterium]